LPPHLHCLVTGGGLTEAGQWGAVRHGFLLPMRVVMAVFRGKLLAAIRQGLHQGQLTPPPGKSAQPVENLRNKLGRQKWNVHIRERYPYGHGVLIYLARCLRGGPIANRRLLACAGQQVVFGYTERAESPGGQATRRTMRLSLEQFVGRWLLHVPPPGAVLVRGWGLYAHTQGAALAACRQQLGQGPVEAPPPWEWQSACAERGEAPPERCPVCGQRLVCTALLPRAGVPPPAVTEWEQVACGSARPWERGDEPARAPVCPAEGCPGVFAGSLPPHWWQRLPSSLPTTPRAGDLPPETARCQSGIAIQAP
jgi:hypothetical protein